VENDFRGFAVKFVLQQRHARGGALAPGPSSLLEQSYRVL
jgi:hypothetical protein